MVFFLLTAHLTSSAYFLYWKSSQKLSHSIILNHCGFSISLIIFTVWDQSLTAPSVLM